MVTLLSAPLAAHHCPLCGGPNGCAPAASGSFATPCWCRTARISPEVLARVPAEQRGRACLCARCASAAAGEGPTADQAAIGTLVATVVTRCDTDGKGA